MGVVTVGEYKPSISGKRTFRPSSSIRHATEWPISDVSSDLTIEVGASSFALHKFPLVSRSGRIRKLLLESRDSKVSRISLPSVPGGAEAFELAAKFCYGVNIEITLSNVAMLRCIAHFLEMTEDFAEKNLLTRAESYLKETVLSNIANSISVLHRCETLLPFSEEIGLVNRLINAISSNVCKEELTSGLQKLDYNFPSKTIEPETPSQWWGKSLTVLNLDFFKRVLSAMKSKGLKQDIISKILINYAHNSLQVVKGSLLDLEVLKNQRILVETITSLLPTQSRKSQVPIAFLSSLLKSAIATSASTSCRSDLEKRIGLQLDQAILEDILIPTSSYQNNNRCSTIYDTDSIVRIFSIFLNLDEEDEDDSRMRDENEMVYDFDSPGSPKQSSILKVSKLLDNYLAEVALDPNLFPSKLEWSNFSENLNSELKEDSLIKKIVCLSYHDLSYNLKSCLLYFGLYPEGCIVPSKILIRQWMAERFVKDDMEETFEEVAKGYLTELINRSLVQVVSISIDGRAKSCCVHDLVHATILEKCEDLSFCKNIDEDDQSSLNGMVRRLSIAIKSDNLMENIENSQVRSLLVKTLNEAFVRRIPTKYRRLSVLDLEHVGLRDVPKDLGCLSHLKYFRFRENFRGDRCVLPKAIGMLENLETLDLTRTSFHAMPKEICKLRKLRHFLGYNMSLIQLKDGIGGMTSLQTLRDVYLDGGVNEVVKLIQELGKLKQLKELVLIGVRSTYMSAISSSINEMQQMEKLHIRANGYNMVIDMDLSSPPPMLRHLTLEGKLEMLPEWIPKLQNLVKLKLKYSELTDDKMELLKSMPNLLSLSLRENAYEAETLHFQHGWFENLKHLYLEDLENLNYIIIDEGALCSLKKLQLTFIRHLKTLPTGIQHLKKLEVLNIKQMSHLFSEAFFFDEGKAHWSFKHVPVVDI